MKRTFFAIVALLLLIPAVLINTRAADSTSETGDIYFEDGSYIRVEIFSTDLRETGRKIGHKDYTYYNSDGEEQWRATLTGSFTYTGTSAVCTSSSCSVSISDSNWSVESKTADRSGNAAIAKLIMKWSQHGATKENIEVSIRLTCDENGNLS